ncbi:MAG: tetratricopeptide repeat protein, partial [Firmicutes bacterium]|nr:tetratricopeptide repeat protein [Bacillota bacterium]
FYKKAVEIRERLCKRNPDAFEPDLAMSYNNLGVLYANIQEYEDAELFLKKAVEIQERLSKRNPDAFEPDLAMSYNNLRTLYNDMQSAKDSKKHKSFIKRLFKKN